MRRSRWTWLAVGVALLMGVGWLPGFIEVAAQSSDALASLTIALWPEYDRPEVLVIYQGALKPETSLPATVSIAMPSHVHQMHAVAYLDENTGTLMRLDSFRLEATAQGKRLTLTTPARRFHAEYYTADVLTREGATRTIHYVFTATTTIENFRFEVQQPLGALDFVSDPVPVAIEKRADNLFYARYPAEALAAGASRSLRVAYQRHSDRVSSEAMPSTPEALAGPPGSGAA
ncbi:MAG: hypothetical protein NZ765_09140, partial [Anaerolineae bacterium]|nr:hypothetical protein [Anaerolineae bacterium]MDW8071258.1 hypothetical protein [Anaerolineae bacterium]